MKNKFNPTLEHDIRDPEEPSPRAECGAPVSRVRVKCRWSRGERLTTENYVENLGNFIVSCLTSFQLLGDVL